MCRCAGPGCLDDVQCVGVQVCGRKVFVMSVFSTEKKRSGGPVLCVTCVAVTSRLSDMTGADIAYPVTLPCQAQTKHEGFRAANLCWSGCQS